MVAQNTPPMLTPPADQSAPEGSATAFNLGSFTDPDLNDSWTVDVDWGDGSGHTLFSPAAPGPLGTQPHTYADNKPNNGPYAVTTRITDKAGASDSKIFNIVVTNVAPTAALSSTSPINEGSNALISFTNQFDPSPVDVQVGFHYAFACDGSALNSATYVGSGTSAATSCPFDDGPSDHTVRARIIDKDDGYSEYTTLVHVNNVPPTATFVVPTQSGNEGSTFTIQLTNAFDPSNADTVAGFTYAFDCGGGYAAAGSTSSTACPAVDNPGVTVRGKIADKDGGTTEYTANVVILNVPPTVGLITAPASPVQISAAISASAPFTDPGIRDTHTAAWAWGDGTTTAATVTESNGSGSVSGSHTYTAAGVYTLTVTVTDKDGGQGQSTFQYVVAYDPTGGFVTGGGWITTPAGACQLTTGCQGVSGKTTFGFVSKYLNGATVPTGSTEFQFRDGNLNFHSTSYQWLVIAGAKAQYKGSGTINGQGSYAFMLTAVDGDLPGGGGVDKLRMKIWDATTGTTVYDNQMGAGDASDPTTALQGGDITIHSH
jgi:hypothetical protein